MQNYNHVIKNKSRRGKRQWGLYWFTPSLEKGQCSAAILSYDSRHDSFLKARKWYSETLSSILGKRFFSVRAVEYENIFLESRLIGLFVYVWLSRWLKVHGAKLGFHIFIAL